MKKYLGDYLKIKNCQYRQYFKNERINETHEKIVEYVTFNHKTEKSVGIKIVVPVECSDDDVSEMLNHWNELSKGRRSYFIV